MKNSEYTISEIKSILQDSPSEDQLKHFREDKRAGVIKILEQYNRRKLQYENQILKFETKKKFEEPFWDRGLYVAGVDEVGRGPLAGPVVSAAVILPKNNTLIDVDDSKKLSAKNRLEIYNQICEQAVDISVSIGSVELIDRENIYHATELIMKDAIDSLYIKPNHILVDAMTIPVDIEQTKLIKGDAKSISIGAASIVAKVMRDNLMNYYDRKYPEFKFKKNDGYGTKDHLDALNKYGRTPIHRMSFSPVKKSTKLY
ncbi:ribonuclease HII [Lactobacillus terrae]|uniref:ribonuclease HII n=1 Tax=Lactobacillus terrae TaxID=2269374 RepID=UPI000C1B77DD|nr:ribonuclease HII [Lactobacillus terrae]